MSEDFNFNVETNAEAIAEFFGAVALRQIPYAALRTTHDLAFEVRNDVLTEMETVFHKPTPFTLRSMEVIKGTKATTPPSSWVELRDHRLWRTALAHQFTGGVRKLKRIEESFRRVNILPPGKFIIPTSVFPMDAYDNPNKGLLNQLTAFFGAFGEQGYRANMTPKTKKAFLKKKGLLNLGAPVDFFVSRGDHGLAPGIWQRLTDATDTKKTHVRPLLLFISTPHYQRLIHLPEIAHEVVSTLGAQTFAIHLRRAMASDRRLAEVKRLNGWR